MCIQILLADRQAEHPMTFSQLKRVHSRRLTPSYEAVGCYGRGGQTGDGGDQRGHQNDRNSQSYHQQK